MSLEIAPHVYQWLTASNFTAGTHQDLQEPMSRDTNLVGYWEQSLKNLTTQQRTVFTVIVILVGVLAIFGNLLTVITNVRRKQRHLFRVCLLTLALSDICFVTVTSIVYLSQFNTEYNSLWTLGEVACNLAPFFQTMAVLVNSITLVAIALDRYMAVVRLTKGIWEPSGIFCIICSILIWGLAAGISTPMLTLYEIYNVVVLLADPAHPKVITGYFMAEMCATDKTKNGYYFGIVFTVIFLPALLSFLWLNSVIAKEIWTRRNPIQTLANLPKKSKKPSPTDTSGDRKTTTTTNISSTIPIGRHTSQKCTCINCLDVNSPPREPPPPPPLPPRPATHASPATKDRKRRQLRMFKAIVFIIAVFFCCRLPMWVYLLVKLHGVANTNSHWVLHYTFGIMAMVNCVLNPLIYTFLSETIKFSIFCKTLCLRFWVDPCRRSLNRMKTRGWKPKEEVRKPCCAASAKRTSHRGGIFFGD
ncbi:hypothetical protein quinque_005909 [Culex quinquefasciatus]